MKAAATRQAPGAARSAAFLSRTARYITPTGRWCRWVPGNRGGKGVEEFEFLPGPDGAGASAGGDRMLLSARNVHILRRITA